MIGLINCSTGKIHNVIPDSFLSDPSDKAVSRPHNQIQIPALYALTASLLSTGLTYGSSLTNKDSLPFSYFVPTSASLLFFLSNSFCSL